MHQNSSGRFDMRGVIDLFQAHGDFHDCFIERLVIDYTDRRVAIHLDDISAGLVSDGSTSGVVHFGDVESVFCQIPFVGGEVRIDGAQVSETELGLSVCFQLTTTEWMNTVEFEVIRLEIIAKKISLETL